MPKVSERQNRKIEQKQKALVDAAKHLFSTKGYAGTTIEDIANRADVAKVTFYHYFKSKEEIALRIRSLCIEESLAYTEILLSERLTPDQMIERVISDIADWTLSNWRLLNVFSMQRFSPLFERTELTTECKPEPMVICLSAIINQGQSLGQYRATVDSTKVAKLLDLAIMLEQYQWIKNGRHGRESLVLQLRDCFDLILNGVGAAKNFL